MPSDSNQFFTFHLSKNSKRLHILLLIFILLFGLLIRVLYIRETRVYDPVAQGKDSRHYIAYGYNLTYHQTFSKQWPGEQTDSQLQADSFRSPGYPMLVTLAFKLGGKENFDKTLLRLQITLGVLTILSTYILGRAILSPWPALIATLFIAVNPHLVSMTNYFLTETLFCFLLTTSLLLFSAFIKRAEKMYAYFSALVFGLSYFTNETTLFLPYLLITGTWLFSQKKFPEKTITFLLVFSLFPIGWHIRNTLNVEADAIKGNDRALNTLVHGSYPDFFYKTEKYRNSPYSEDPQFPTMVKSYGDFWQIISKRIAKQPLKYIFWYLKKPFVFWDWGLRQGRDIYVYVVTTSLYQKSFFFDATRKLLKIIHVPMIVLMCWSFILCLSKNISTAETKSTNIVPIILCITLGYFTLLYAFFAPWPRYSVPLRPIFYIFGLWGGQQLINPISKRLT